MKARGPWRVGSQKGGPHVMSCHMTYVVCRMSYLILICHMSYVICHINMSYSYVISHINMSYSCVICHMSYSYVICHMSYVASRRVTSCHADTHAGARQKKY